MIFEIIAIVLLVDSVAATIVGFTKLGDTTLEQFWFIRRYFPLSTGWTLVYLALSSYIAYLTFVVL